MFPNEVIEKVDQALLLENEIKSKKKELDGIKAELQTEALAFMSDKNLKWKQFAGNSGVCNVAYKEKFEIDNADILSEICGTMAESKLVKKIEVKYDVDDSFKKALIALYKRDYRQVDLQKVLEDMGLMGHQVKLALKKLKGDYIKDKELLESLGVSGELEEELDAIHDQKNYELVSRYFDLNAIDEEFFKKLKIAINVEDSLAIGLTAVKEGGGGHD